MTGSGRFAGAGEGFALSLGGGGVCATGGVLGPGVLVAGEGLGEFEAEPCSLASLFSRIYTRSFSEYRPESNNTLLTRSASS